MRILYYALHCAISCILIWIGSRYFVSAVAAWDIAFLFAFFQIVVSLGLIRMQRYGDGPNGERARKWSRIIFLPQIIGLALIVAHILLPGIRHQ